MQPQHDSQQSIAAPVRPAPTAADVQKLRVEIAHLDLLVKKLQAELQIGGNTIKLWKHRFARLTGSALAARKPAAYFL